jgi:pseudouridine-5'-phosphate glycosidase
MFRALLAHHQEALHIQQLVYFVRTVSAGCYQGWSGTPTLVADILRCTVNKTLNSTIDLIQDEELSLQELNKY